MNFYPVHMVFLNIDHEAKVNHILCDRTIIGYLLVEVFSTEIRKDTKELVRSIDNHSSKLGTKRGDRLNLLHMCLHIALNKISFITMCGFGCQTKEAYNICQNAVIGSYLADMSTEKDMICVIYGKGSNRNCSRCFVHAADMEKVTNAHMRSLKRAKGFI